MKSVIALFALIAIARANPIVVEPVNPVAVQDGVSKVVDSIPLANAVQSVPAQSVQPQVQSAVNPVASAVASAVQNVASQVAAAAVPSNVVPSTYAKQPIAVADPVVEVPKVDEIVNANVDQSVVPSVPSKQIIPGNIASIPSAIASQAQSQASGFQSQVASVGGQVVSQMQNQASQVQSQVAALPSLAGGIVPSGIIGSKVAAPSNIVPDVPVASVAPVLPVDIVPVADKNSAEQEVFTKPINQATELVKDVDEALKKYLPAEDEIATTIAPHIYSGDVAETEAERQQNQMTNLIDQVNRLAESIERTINGLVAERRYITAAMLRSMLNYVRRVRVNLERLQNRLQSVQAVATSGQNAPAGSAPAGSNIPGAAFLNTVRDRINRMTEEIGALVTRIRSSLTPGVGAPATTSPLPPLVTAANIANIGAAAAAGSIVSAINTVNSQPQNTVVAAQATA